jgi:hypothetical protein
MIIRPALIRDSHGIALVHVSVEIGGMRLPKVRYEIAIA